MNQEQKFAKALELLEAVRAYGQGYNEDGNFAEYTEEGYAEVADPFDEALVEAGYILEDIEEGPTFSAHLMIGYSHRSQSTQELLNSILEVNRKNSSA